MDSKTLENKKWNVLSYQWDRIMEWTPKSDVWPFLYGVPILTTATALSAVVINSYFRKKLKLLKHGVGITHFILAISPALLGYLLHIKYVSEPIITNKLICPICLEAKAVTIQNLCSIVYPITLSVLANFPIAYSVNSYHVPHYLEVGQLAKTVWTLLKPFGRKLMIIFCLQTILSSFIVYKEMTSMYNIQQLTRLLEEDYQEQRRMKKLSNI